MKKVDPAATWKDLFSDGRGVYSVILILGMSLYAMDAFIVATIMPTVVASIGGGEFYAWVLMLYMTASIVGAASGGPIKLRLGSRNGFVTAGLIFLVGTLVVSLSPSMSVLLSGRVIAGFGAGLIAAQSTALIGEIFPSHLRTRMIAAVSTVWATSALAGPMVGGIFAQVEFWRGAFLFAAAMIVTFTIMAYRVLPTIKTKEKQSTLNLPIGRLALLGAGVFMIGVTGNVTSIFSQVACFSAGLFLLFLVIRIDSQVQKNRVFPSMPFSLNSPVGAANWILLLISTAPVAIGLYMPLAYQTIYGLSPIAAGYLGALLALFWTLGTFLSAGLKLSAQPAALTMGPLMASLGILGVGLVMGDLSWLIIAAFTGLAGLGIGICMPHLMNWTMILALKGEESITASSIQTIRSLGIALAAAVAGIIANTSGLGRGINQETVIDAIRWVESLAATAPAAAIVLAIILVRHRKKIAAETSK